jgi:hypothetical protein
MAFLFCLVVAFLFELASSNKDHDDIHIEKPFDDNLWFGLLMGGITVSAICALLSPIIYPWCKRSCENCMTKKEKLVVSIVLPRDTTIEDGNFVKKEKTVVSTTAIVQPEIVADAA